MHSMTTVRTFTGGPLDGQTDGPITSGQMPAFMQASRKPLNVRAGERIDAAVNHGIPHDCWATYRGRTCAHVRKHRACYALQRVMFDTLTGDKIRAYKWLDMDA